MTSKLLRWHTGTKTTFSLELPKRDGTDGLADLTPYTDWTVELLDEALEVVVTLATDDDTIVGGSIGLLTVTPSTAHLTALAALEGARYVVRATGTTADGEVHRWSARLLIDTVLN